MENSEIYLLYNNKREETRHLVWWTAEHEEGNSLPDSGLPPPERDPTRLYCSTPTFAIWRYFVSCAAQTSEFMRITESIERLARQNMMEGLKFSMMECCWQAEIKLSRRILSSVHSARVPDLSRLVLTGSIPYNLSLLIENFDNNFIAAGQLISLIYWFGNVLVVKPETAITRA